MLSVTHKRGTACCELRRTMEIACSKFRMMAGAVSRLKATDSAECGSGLRRWAEQSRGTPQLGRSSGLNFPWLRLQTESIEPYCQSRAQDHPRRYRGRSGNGA